MSRYIDAIKFAKQAYEVAYPIVHDNNSHERGLTLMGIAQLLDEQPTADVVEVVRCKDCRFWQDNNGGYPNMNCRWFVDETPDADDFCSYGERADNGN